MTPEHNALVAWVLGLPVEALWGFCIGGLVGSIPAVLYSGLFKGKPRYKRNPNYKGYDPYDQCDHCDRF